ncbi:MAG: acyl-CoA thioesterase [Acidimicrobiales bacterium]
MSRPSGSERHLFGGLLVARAVRAAYLTLDDGERHPHSMHCSFLQAGDGRLPVSYEVERTRDGSSFSTRRVVADQGGEPIFVATASFHAMEIGPDYELAHAMPVPGPDGLPVGRYDNPWFESRDVPVGTGPVDPPHARRAWFRARLPLPDDPALHSQALAYMTDHGPTRAVREPHADHPGVDRRMSVSLDHAVWFHEPVRVDEWLLSEFTPVATGHGRGLTIGTVRTSSGRLVATVAQESLLRLPDA